MNVFAALADGNRQAIVAMLAKRGQLTVAQIRQEFSISAPAISQHLKVLRQAKMVYAVKDAQQRIYRLNEEGLTEAGDWLKKIESLWLKRLNAMDNYVIKLKKKGKNG